MPKLTGKLGEWELPYVHMWKDRKSQIDFQKTPILSASSKIVTIGSCFAEELAHAIDRLGFNGAMHPSGLYYNTSSIRQEVERIFGGWPEYKNEPDWQVKGGFIHPFKSYYDVHKTSGDLRNYSDSLDARADDLFKSANIVVITLGLIETWRHPTTGNTYRQIPPPAVFETYETKFHRLTVSEMIDDLIRIRKVIYENTSAKLIITVSPVPLHSTFTPLDVRVANNESKSRIRAAVSEFVEMFPDVYYFHSYDIVATAERLSDFMLEDGRHVHRHAVDYILQQFLLKFADSTIPIPVVNSEWLTAPEKVAARPMVERSFFGKIVNFLKVIKSRIYAK